jgi:hypothetical protein
MRDSATKMRQCRILAHWSAVGGVIGTSTHIPSVSLFLQPPNSGNVSYHSRAREKSDLKTVYSRAAWLFLTLILTLKFLHPTEYSQSMSSTKLKWLFCIPFSVGPRWPSVP